MNRFLKRSAAVVLCVMLLVSSAMADAERKQPYANSKLNEAEDVTQSDSLDFTVITADPDTVDNPPELSGSVSTILGGLQEGQTGAVKNVDPVSAKDGIVKIDIDAAYKPETVNIAFVLDRSGSMNMWVKTNDAQLYSFTSSTVNAQYRNPNVSPHNVPCMNPEHSYLINYYIIRDDEKKNQQYRYFPTDQNGNVRAWLTALVDGNLTEEERQLNDGDHAHGSWLENQIENSLRQQSEIPFAQDGDIFITSIGTHLDSQGNEITPDISGGKGDYGFCSPETPSKLQNGYKTSNGCFDRSMLARHMIWKFVEQVYEADADNKVAYTAFAGTAPDEYTIGFTSGSGKENLKTIILDDRDGDQYTNYTVGLEKAKAFFQNEEALADDEVQPKKVLIFVSDGNPSPRLNTEDGTGVSVANELKAAGVEIYAVGVNIGDETALKNIASGTNGAGHAADCETAEEFIDFLRGTMEMVLEKKVTIEDALGENYSLLVDAQHPFMVIDGNDASKTVTITSQDALDENGIIYTSSSRVISTTMETGKKGIRLSFYAQLNEAKRNPSESGVVHYPTNTDMTYQPEGGQLIHVSVSDKLTVSHTKLTAAKDNGNMKDKTVVPGDIIPYRITVKNTNGYDLTRLVVTDVIPEGTEYVKNSASAGGVYDETKQQLIFTAETIAANGEVSFQFSVKVLPGLKNIVNRATFTVAEAVEPGSEGSAIQLIAKTNEVVNPRGDVPQVIAKKSNGSMADKAVKPGDVIPYTITLTNANDFALTNIIVTDNIPEGTEYVLGSGGEYNSVLNQVKFTAASIPARQEKSFTFYVKVLDGTNVIVNKANYSVAEIVQPDPENPDVPVRVIFETNEVVNPRAVFTEVIPNVPQTGDNASPLVWALLALMSLACITMMMNRKKA